MKRWTWFGAAGVKTISVRIILSMAWVAMKAKTKVHRVMSEFKHRELHSGSKKGPVVKSRKQAVAIALSEARRGKR